MVSEILIFSLIDIDKEAIQACKFALLSILHVKYFMDISSHTYQIKPCVRLFKKITQKREHWKKLSNWFLDAFVAKYAAGQSTLVGAVRCVLEAFASGFILPGSTRFTDPIDESVDLLRNIPINSLDLIVTDAQAAVRSIAVGKIEEIFK